MKRYEFTVTLASYGDTQEQAWQDACAEFALEPREPHDDVVITEEPDDDPLTPEQAAQMVGSNTA